MVRGNLFGTARWVVYLLMGLAAWMAVAQSSRQKIITESNLNLFPGFQLLEDYGSFRLYRVSESVLAQLPQAARTRVRRLVGVNRLYLDRHPFDTQSDRLMIPGHLRASPTQDPALMLIQFHGPIRQGWLDEVKTLGAKPVHYVRSNGYLVLANGIAAQALATLAHAPNHVQYFEPFHPYFKFGAGLLALVENPNSFPDTVRLTLQMVDHPEKQKTQSIIANLMLSERVGWHTILNFQNISGEFRTADIVRLATLPDVNWLGLYREPKLLDEVQGQILAGALNAMGTAPVGTGYLNALTQMGFSQNEQDYPILDITDDGIGNGHLISGDTTLHVQGNSGLASRLVYLHNCTTATDAGSTQGHGHINASIAAGYDVRSGFPFRDTSGYQRGLGINPFQRVGGTRLFGPNLNLTFCGESYLGLIQQIVRTGARISNHSWGCEGCADQYDDISQAFDVGTRDGDGEAPGNQPLMLVVAAGNNGPGPATVATPGNAKNVLTVGASENYRPTWVDGCNVGPDGADSAMDIIEFSSRGPAPGGRAKPELVAPGTHIYGSASAHPNYTGGGICDGYHPPGQTAFAASSGTSHSAPAISAMASLAHHWLQNQSKAFAAGYEPSPAMLKAFLLAHTATYLTGESAGDTLPSPNQGYGMPNIAVAFEEIPRLLIDESIQFDQSGDFWAFSGLIPESNKPVRIVLAYTDQAGALGTSPQVNDLNLEVKLNGNRYFGNQFLGRWSQPGGAPDAANNYEAVFLPAGSQGLLEVRVIAANIAGDGLPGLGDATDQDFALAAYNFESVADFTLNVTPFFQSVCSGNQAEYTVSIGRTLGFGDVVQLGVTDLPPGLAGQFDSASIVPPGNAVLTLSNTQAVPAGNYQVTVNATSTTGSKTFDVLLRLFDGVPTQAVLQSPANGAVDVPFIPTLRWFANPSAERYLVEVALDPAFQQQIYATTTYEANIKVPLALDTLTTYYWRVQPINICGPGSTSAVSTFTTLQPPAILLVDDDDDDPDVLNAYTQALIGLNEDFDVWDVAASGREPNALELTHHTTVIWFSGGAYGNRAGPDPNDGEVALKSWLDSGGCLFLSSQDYYFDFGLTQIAVDYLGVDSMVNDATHQTVFGAPGSLFENLGPYNLVYPGNNFSDAVLPQPDANEALIGNDGTAGISRKTSAYRTVFIAFPLEALVPTTERSSVLQAFLNRCTGACAGPADFANRLLEWPVLEDIRDLVQCLNAYTNP